MKKNIFLFPLFFSAVFFASKKDCTLVSFVAAGEHCNYQNLYFGNPENVYDSEIVVNLFINLKSKLNNLACMNALGLTLQWSK